MKPLLDTRRLVAVLCAVAAGSGVAAAIAGRELRRISGIWMARPLTEDTARALAEERVMWSIVVVSAASAAAFICLALAVTRSTLHLPIGGCFGPILGFGASLPLYYFVYREAPAGWHINIAEEYRWAQPAAVMAAVAVYTTIRTRQRPRGTRSDGFDWPRRDNTLS